MSRRSLSLGLSMIALFATWACVWILRPTELWKRSWHAAETRASHTFLGSTGLDVVVLCLPLLAMATMGYLYLHLCTNEEGRRISKQRTTMIPGFPKPIIIDSTIGILYASELLAASMFVALLAWTYYSNVSTDLKKMVPSKSLRLNTLQLKISYLGVRLGSLSEACLAILFLPVLRGMSLFKIFGIQFEASVRYHVWIANGMILFSILHGTTMMSLWGVEHNFWKEAIKWQRTGRVNLAGVITLATGIIIWITSLPPIRRNQFNLFYAAHHLYVIFILFFLLHAGDRHFFLVFSGVLLFALDKLLRVIQSRRATSVLSARLLRCKAIELTLPKHPCMKYTPTSTIFVKIPSISKFQWHPFSITSSCNIDHERLTILIKCQGQWTESLYNMIQSMPGSECSKPRSLSIFVEGPYGPTNLPYRRYDNLFLIAGGSGITPLLSIIQDIGSTQCSPSSGRTEIQLVYVVKSSEDLGMLTPISQFLLNDSPELRYLRLKIFVTREECTNTTGTNVREILQLEKSTVKTIEMNNPTSFLPIPLSLLSKAAITGFSSVIFLALLVCLTRAFAHKGKGSMEVKSPSWVGDVLVLCSFVLAVGCAMVVAVLSSSRKEESEFGEVTKNRAETKEMQYAEEHGVLGEHEIIYGKRPNLVEVLSELVRKTGGFNVGVFVCGPDSMQRPVASFCRNYGDKLRGDEERKKCAITFHSINFSL